MSSSSALPLGVKCEIAVAWSCLLAIPHLPVGAEIGDCAFLKYSIANITSAPATTANCGSSRDVVKYGRIV